MNFLVLVKLKGIMSLEDMIVLFIKRVGRFLKVIDMSGSLKKKNIKICFDVVIIFR